MNYILVTVKTKIPLTKLLINAVVQHLETQGVEYFIVRNGLTHSSFSCEGVRSDKEGKTAVILGLSEMELKQQNVVYIYSNEVFSRIHIHHSSARVLRPRKCICSFTILCLDLL